VRANGKLWGVPLAFKSLALFYRKDLIAHPPATTDELVALAKQIKATKPAGNYALAYESGASFYHAPWLHGFGGQLLDGAGRPALDSDGADRIGGVRRGAGRRRPSAAGVDRCRRAQLFNDGRAALTINGPWFVGEIAPGVPFGVAPLPTGGSATGKPAAPLVEIEALLMPARGRDPKAAAALRAWLAGGERRTPRQRRSADVGGARGVGRSEDRQRSDPVGVPRAARRDRCRCPTRQAIQPGVGEPLNQALRKGCAARPARWPAIDRGQQKRIVEALRPPPPEAPASPYVALFGVVVLGGAVWTLRRALTRGGIAAARAQSGAYAYLAPAAIAMIVLVFVPLCRRCRQSLFWHDAGRWTFIGLRNFADILASAPGAGDRIRSDSTSRSRSPRCGPSPT